MLLMGPHLSPYSTKAKRWNWEILNAKNWINSTAGGTFLAEVYNDLDRLIHAKVTQEDEKTARAKIELPSGEVVRIDKKIPGFGTANLFKKKIPENSYLSSIGVSVSDIPAMLDTRWHIHVGQWKFSEGIATQNCNCVARRSSVNLILARWR